MRTAGALPIPGFVKRDDLNTFTYWVCCACRKMCMGFNDQSSGQASCVSTCRPVQTQVNFSNFWGGLLFMMSGFWGYVYETISVWQWRVQNLIGFGVGAVVRFPPAVPVPSMPTALLVHCTTPFTCCYYKLCNGACAPACSSS
jgi:hypothetical protein